MALRRRRWAPLLPPLAVRRWGAVESKPMYPPKYYFGYDGTCSHAFKMYYEADVGNWRLDFPAMAECGKYLTAAPQRNHAVGSDPFCGSCDERLRKDARELRY